MTADQRLNILANQLGGKHYDEAQQHFQKLLKEEADNTFERANLLMNVANLIMRLLAFESGIDAHALYQESINIYLSLTPIPMREAANAEMGLGYYYYVCGWNEEAETCFKKSKEVYAALLQSTNNDTLIDIVKVNFHLANLYLSENRIREAIRKLLVAQYILINFYPSAENCLDNVTKQLDFVSELTKDTLHDPPNTFIMTSYDSWINKAPELNFVLESEKFELPPLNKIILDLPIALLTGAGASIPLGFPSMIGLVDRINKKFSDFKMFSDKKKFDFEDTLKKLLQACYKEDKLSIKRNKQSKKSKELGKLLYNVRNLLFEELSKTPNLEIVKSLYGPLIKYLWKINSHLPVFSFNYDRTFECFAKINNISLISGFPSTRRELENFGDMEWNPDEYTKYMPNENQKDIILFKLHGSINWRNNYLFGKIVQIDDELTRIMPGYGELIIYPIQPKISFLNPILELLDAYFSESLTRLKILVAIGYSFRDAHVVSKIENAKQINSDLMLISIDPHAQKFKKIFRKMGFKLEKDLFLIDKYFEPTLDFSNLLDKPIKIAMNKI